MTVVLKKEQHCPIPFGFLGQVSRRTAAFPEELSLPGPSSLGCWTGMLRLPLKTLHPCAGPDSKHRTQTS